MPAVLSSLAGQSVATDDGGRVDLVLDQVFCILQQLSSNDHLHSRDREDTANQHQMDIHTHTHTHTRTQQLYKQVP